MNPISSPASTGWKEKRHKTPHNYLSQPKPTIYTLRHSISSQTLYLVEFGKVVSTQYEGCYQTKRCYIMETMTPVPKLIKFGLCPVQ